MTALAYKKIALEWQPSAANSRQYNKILLAVLLLAVALAVPLSIIKVPPERRHQPVAIPDRIADFIAHKDKPIPKPPKLEVKPKPPQKPLPEPVPVEKPEAIQEHIRERDLERKPLTDSEKRARKVAQNSGLLALSNELNDLIDTKDINVKLNKKISTDIVASATTAAAQSNETLTTGIAQSGGTVDQRQNAASLGKTELESRKINTDLDAHAAKEDAKVAATKAHAGGNAEEDVTLVFDKNKGGLYSLYERERRTTQGLQGKIVLQLTISPNGDVIDVKIISSELNSPELEARILSRVKTFKFNGGGTKPVTVTYPIEFLPS